MKFVKEAILGGSAFIIAAPDARSAELPAFNAAPANYVRVCGADNAGFFTIPGTDTCLRVGGYIRYAVEFTPGQKIINVATGAVSQRASSQDSLGMETRGRVDIDARTRTSFGLVQTVIHLRGSNSDGLRHEGPSSNFGPSYNPAGNGATNVTMERAFLRFAGVTAGVSNENFSTIPAYIWGGTLYPGFPNGIKQLAYTGTFGGGFSATLAAESLADLNYTNVTGTSAAPSGVPTAISSQIADHPDTGVVGIANARYDGAWGYFQASGAFTRNSVSSSSLTSTSNPLAAPSTYGAWAAGFSFRYNLNFIAQGDQFHFETQIAHGIDGLVMGAGTSSINDPDVRRFLGGVMRVDSNLVPTRVSATGAVQALATENAGSVYGVLTHYFSPSWRSNADLGLARFVEPKALSNGVGAGLNTQLGNATLIAGGANLIWSPIKDMNIGAELDYARLTQSIQNPSAAFIAAREPGLGVSQYNLFLRADRLF